MNFMAFCLWGFCFVLACWFWFLSCGIFFLYYHHSYLLCLVWFCGSLRFVIIISCCCCARTWSRVGMEVGSNWDKLEEEKIRSKIQKEEIEWGGKWGKTWGKGERGGGRERRREGNKKVGVFLGALLRKHCQERRELHRAKVINMRVNTGREVTYI